MKFTLVIGNPPYGDKTLKFINKAAELTESIRYILPRSIRKASRVNKINPHLHLTKEVLNEEEAFGREIRTVTHYYEFRDSLRKPIKEIRHHPDFQFSTKNDPHTNVFIMRSGLAGKVLTENYSEYEESHYFIRARNKQVIDNIVSIGDELESLSYETTALRKVSKPDIINTYIKRYGEPEGVTKFED